MLHSLVEVIPLVYVSVYPKRSNNVATKAKKVTIKPAMVKKFDLAFKSWKGGNHIAVLAKELGVRRGALRRQLRKRAGGKEAFKALRATGAGGIRASLGERPKSVDLDKKALLIPVGGRKDWTHRYVNVPEGKMPVFVAKGGLEYRSARKTEAADALAAMGNGLPPARLKVYFDPKA